MKKIIAALSAAALTTVAIGSSMLVGAAPAKAQAYTGRILCLAASQSAYGYGAHVNSETACRMALYQCASRTPYGDTCYITRVTYERAY